MDKLPPPIPADAAIAARLAERVDVHNLSRGMVVGITDVGGHRIIAHGLTGASGGRPLSADTLFEIGSITKLFTALLLAGMIIDGVVAIGDPVQDLLPSGITVPSRNGRAITLGDLVSHRAGLPRFPSNFGLDRQTDPAKPYTPELLYDFLADHTLTRTPGDVAVYANTRFGLLGHALALRAGQPYEDLVRARVLQPPRLGQDGHRGAIAPRRRARHRARRRA